MQKWFKNHFTEIKHNVNMFLKTTTQKKENNIDNTKTKENRFKRQTW